MHAQELTRLNEVGAAMRSAFESRMNSFEAGSGPRHFAMDGQGSWAPRLRVPDSGSWKLEVFKNKDDDFHAWRESFELQVGLVWSGLKPSLEVLRDTKVENAEHWIQLRNSKLLNGCLPPGSNDADWTYQLVSNKLVMILYIYFEQDPKKVVSLAQNCGIEAYR